MSGNLDLVRSIYADWERGDFGSDTWADPGIEMVNPDALLPDSIKGVAEMAQSWRDWLSTWETFRVQADEYVELDRECILVFAHFSGRGKTSKLELAQTVRKGASVFHVRGGKVTKLVLYLDRDRALADLGLEG